MRRARDLLRANQARGALVVDEHHRTRFFGMTVFASEAAVAKLSAGLQPRLGAALFSECEAGAILDSRGIGRENGSGGLHMVVIAQGYDMTEATDSCWGAVVGTVLKAFQGVHRGFRLARSLSEVFGRDGVRVMTTSGVYPDVQTFSARDLSGADVPSAVFSIPLLEGSGGSDRRPRTGEARTDSCAGSAG